MLKFENVEDIKENIQKGLNAIENNLNKFTEEEKENYFYMVNNIEVLLADAYKIAVRENKIKYYKKLIEEIQKSDTCALGKIDILYELMSFDAFNELDESTQSKILDFTYTYWIDNDFAEYNIYNICDIVIRSDYYSNQSNILDDIENIDYNEFEKRLELCW
jgi:hypothetical protein